MSSFPIYVIHSASLPEREQHVSKELEAAGLTWKWITGYEPESITPEVDRIWFDPASDLSIRQKSCALKHIFALQAIRDEQCDNAIVFEDDIILDRDFASKFCRVLEEAATWPRPFVIDLGVATNFYTPATNLKKEHVLYVGPKHRNAEAYLIGSHEASLRLSWFAKHKIKEPIDIAFNHCDAQSGIKIVWTEPPLAEQGSLTGKFTSSLDPKKRTRLILRLQFPLQKFRRKYLKRWVNVSRFSFSRHRERTFSSQNET